MDNRPMDARKKITDLSQALDGLITRFRRNELHSSDLENQIKELAESIKKINVSSSPAHEGSVQSRPE